MTTARPGLWLKRHRYLTCMVTPRQILTSSRQDWRTPKPLFDRLDEAFHFGLDPCTSEDNPLGTGEFYTATDNGLARPWRSNAFVNPPYNRQWPLWKRPGLSRGYTIQRMCAWYRPGRIPCCGTRLCLHMQKRYVLSGAGSGFPGVRTHQRSRAHWLFSVRRRCLRTSMLP